MDSLRNIAENCLNKTGTLSIKRDFLGVMANDNPQVRSLGQRLQQIENNQFVRIAIVVIQGATPNIQRDLDNTNLVFGNSCNTWVYPMAMITSNSPNLLVLDQDDCGSAATHSVSVEEAQLFALGRNLGANIVAYYINGSNGPFAGCAAFPPGSRGFWVGNGASPWTFGHELGHIVGQNAHVTNSDNLMSTPTASITNLPPDLSSGQCTRVGNDADIETC